MFYLNGKFVPIDVSRWKDKLNCTVNVGVGSGSQQSKMQTMSSIMTILQTIVQNGGMGTLVTPKIYTMQLVNLLHKQVIKIQTSLYLTLK